LPQNIRNGNNYLLLNSELRVPIFSLIAKKPLKSAFLQDFQLVGFFDAGLAYNLANPFNKDNSLSKEVVNDPIRQPIVVTVNYYRNPFVFGAGAGVRTNILGYFFKSRCSLGPQWIRVCKETNVAFFI
jgi:outer membrane protein assembly factor BamA